MWTSQRRDAVSSLTPRVGTDKLVIKAQVLAGGRGKGHFDNGFKGGVHVVDTCVIYSYFLSSIISANLGHAVQNRRKTSQAR